MWLEGEFSTVFSNPDLGKHKFKTLSLVADLAILSDSGDDFHPDWGGEVQ